MNTVIKAGDTIKYQIDDFVEVSSGIKKYLDEWIKIRTSKRWNFSFIN